MEQRDVIIQIGLNHAGTHSLHNALRILGYSVLSPEKYNQVMMGKKKIYLEKKCLFDNYRNAKPLLSGPTFRGYDAFIRLFGIDLELIQRLRMDPRYNVKFIFLDRDILGYIESSVKKYEDVSILESGQSVKYADVLTGAQETHEKAQKLKNFLLDNYDKEELLVMNLIEGDGWEKLSEFLNQDIPKISFPWDNKGRTIKKELVI